MSCQNQYLTVTHSLYSFYKKKQVNSATINLDSVRNLSQTILNLNEILSLFLTQKLLVQLKFTNRMIHKTALLWTLNPRSLQRKMNKRCRSRLQYSVIELIQARAHLWSIHPLNINNKSLSINKVTQNRWINLCIQTMSSTKTSII